MFLAQRLVRPASTLSFSRRLFSTSAVQMNTLYTDAHEWARVSGKSAQIGISNYAQDKLGEIIHVELKVSTGDSINKGDLIAEVESVKSVGEVYAAVSGKVSNVNERLSDDPKILNSSPEQDGWIVEVEVSDKIQQEQKDLFNAAAYAEFCEKEDQH